MFATLESTIIIGVLCSQLQRQKPLNYWRKTSREDQAWIVTEGKKTLLTQRHVMVNALQ
jgi:hypothetical protein